MYVNKQTNFDESLQMAVAQTVAASAYGLDAGAAPIVLDFGNLQGQAIMLNLKVDAVTAGADYSVTVETSDDNTFATGVFVDQMLAISEVAAVTAPKAYATKGFTPKGRYARVHFIKTAGTLIAATAWASITG